MYRRSLSNLLGGSLLVATAFALNACGGETGTGGDMTPSAGTPGTQTSSNTAGTPASTGAAGKSAGAPGATATAGAKATAGTMSTTSGVSSAAGKSGGAGTTAATAGTTGAAAGGTATAAAGGAATATAGTTGGAAGGGMAAAGGSAMAGGTLGGPLKYTGMFTMGTMIDKKYKCPNMGDNKSPPLSWTGGPADTKSFAVVLYDTGYSMLHWAIWDIPATVNELPEGLGAGYNVPSPMGAHQAAAMCMNMPAYCGPCSGTGIVPASTYEYRLYALKTDKLMLPDNSTAAQAQMAIESMMLEKAVWEGKPVGM